MAELKISRVTLVSTPLAPRRFQKHAFPARHKVAIIGGGITGLTAGFYLQRAGIPVTTAKFDAGGGLHNLAEP